MTRSLVYVDVCALRSVFVRSRPKLRFSNKILLTRRALGNFALDDEESAEDVETFLTFRAITSEDGVLRDVSVKCQATLWRSGGDGSFNDRQKGMVESLTLEQDYFTSIEQIQLYHKIDEKSPLYALRESLRHQVECIDVRETRSRQLEPRGHACGRHVWTHASPRQKITFVCLLCARSRSPPSTQRLGRS